MFLLLLLSCDDATTAVGTPCAIDAPVATPAEAAPGTTVSLSLTPVSTPWDTLVMFGPTRAHVQDVLRVDCDACDSCRESAGCYACGDCDGCEADCASCATSVEVEVPAVNPGSWPVVVTSYYGASAPLEFVVSGGGDSGDSGR